MENWIFSDDISVHDRYRFEIKIKLEKDISEKHVFEYYFFIPSSLNISYLTYSKEQFYSSIQRYLRYSTPDMSIAELFNFSSDISPYSRVYKIINSFGSVNNTFLEETAVDEIKLMAAVIKEKIVQLANSDYFEKSVSDILYIKSAVFEAFDKLNKKINSFNCPQSVKYAFRNVDDYITLILMEAFARIIENNSKITPVIRSSLLSAARDVFQYRKSQGYIHPEEDKYNYFLYYRGILKKFVSSCLFLEIQPAFNIYIHMASGIASAVAMFFAVIITLYAQKRYSITSAIFVFIAVISYVFKDRIKEFLKILLTKKAGDLVYDRKIKIKEPAHNFSIGCVKESFVITSPKKVDSDIMKERAEDYYFSKDEILTETVVKYRKIIELDGDKIKKYHTRRHNLVDIMRFSIYDFLKHADDESMKYPVYSSDGVFKMEYFSKNYIIHLIVRYIVSSNSSVYEKYRIIFNRSGIIKVERG